MTSSVVIQQAGPTTSIQDAGRSGGLGIGLSRSGAADRQGYLAALALLDAPLGQAVVECAGLGASFRFKGATRFALAGASMRATIDGAPIEPYASHFAPAGSTLNIQAITQGVYGYLAFGGGIETLLEFGGRGLHRIGGFGQALASGDVLPLGKDTQIDRAPLRLVPRPETGPIRVMPGPQTGKFDPDALETFQSTTFTRSARANRQGVRLDYDGPGFSTGAQLNQVSDFICEGDIQMTGDGTPYVLLADCQTIGGYPRIGTVLPADLHRIAQAEQGAEIRFTFVTLEQAEASWSSDATRLKALKDQAVPRLRDPREMTDLLTYELISKPEFDP